MADKKITELTLLTTADATDILVLVDVSAGVTKRIPVSGLAAAIGANLPGGTITNAMLSTTSGEIGGAWVAWTPTLTGLTVGNGSVIAAYTKIGKTVHFSFKFTMGSTSAVTAAFPSFSLPNTAATASRLVGHMNILLNDLGVFNFQSMQFINSGATSVAFVATIVNGTFAYEAGVTSTAPFTWGSGDSMSAVGWYEAA